MKQGYVPNLAETCDSENPFQLITKIQVAPNSADDGKLLLQALPNLAERTDLEMLYTDGGYGGAELDQSLTDKGITWFQTGIRGKKIGQDKLSFHHFSIHQDETGLPTQVTCSYGQIAPVEVGS